MTADTTAKILDNIFRDINDKDEITFAFQGGEPTLAGLPWFRRFIENVASRKRDIVLHYAFQTNGLLLDESWCDFFYENHFLLGLSVDMGKRFHDHNRLSASGEGTWEACMRTKELLDKKKVEYNILCVLTNELANEPDKAWRFIIDENIRFVQFIPCLEPLPSDLPAHTWPVGTILRPAQFERFYSRLLPYWIKELDNGNYISVKLFDDIVNYFFKGIPTSCGINGQCHNQYVVEADGSVFPCDFYASDKYKIGNLTKNTPRELFSTDKVLEFLQDKPKLPAMCPSCPYFNECQGGCKRLKNVMYAGVGGAICGFRSLLDKCLAPLELAVRRAFPQYPDHH